ncbi:MAG TPA: ribonuclease Z [Bryobacteraceae bacterium]|nr:ribonuclease Z [Bryobacteraceae bacterium]
MQALVAGCGEAFDQELFNTSMLVRTATATVLLDCGYSIPPRIWQAVSDANEIDVVYISHAHADHFFGMPALLGRLWEDGRTKPLTIISQPAVLGDIRAALELGYRGLAERFRYDMKFTAAIQGQVVEAHACRFSFGETRHSVPNLAVRIEAAGKVLCYSGDGMFLDASRKLYAGADLVIHEAYFFEQSPIHADIGAVIEMAEQDGVRQLALVHVQRDLRRRPARIHDAIARSRARVTMPDPGTILP